MKFSDIPQLISGGTYETSVELRDLVEKITTWQTDDYYLLQLIPDFQRGHVWMPQQQTDYVEYFLRGGRSGKTIYFNCPWWQKYGQADYREFVCVDGLQRLTALMGFMQNTVPAFGHLYREFEGRLPSNYLTFNVNDLQTRQAVLTWYLQMNAGGTPHSAEEIARVRQLLLSEEQK